MPLPHELIGLAQILAPAFTQNGRIPRFDAEPVANATLFIERQLTQLRSKIAQVQYAPLKALQYLPLATDISIDASTYAFQVWDVTGRARIGNVNARDIPRIDTNAREIQGNVLSITASYGWSVQDLRTAARLQQDLPSRKSEAARTAISQAIDEIICTGTRTSTGQTATPLGGFINCTDVNYSDVTTHNWFLTAGTTTPEQMVSDLNAVAMAAWTRTKERYAPDTMLMSQAMYTKAVMTKMSSASSVSVLKYFLENSPFIKRVDAWYRLDGAGNTTSHDRVICYPRAPEVLEAVLPIEFEQFPAQQEGLDYVIPCHARCGGVKIYQPGAMQYGDFSLALT